MRRRRAALATMAVGLALLGGAACSAGRGESAADRTAEGSATIPQGGGGGDGAGSATDEVAAGPVEDLEAQAPPAEAPERIIYTSDLRVRVEDPKTSSTEAVALVEEAGGSLASSSEREGEDVVTVTFRVPVAEFRPALDAVAGLGEVLDRQVQAEDVSDQVVDLAGRLENAQASADRLRELYGTAEGVDQIVAIEQALTQREAEVESLAGQLQQLEDRADRSTITTTFVAEGEPVAKEEAEDRSGFTGGLRTGGDVIVAIAGGGATLAGFLLPFLPFVLVAVGIVLLLGRRNRRRGRPGEAQPSEPDEHVSAATE